MDLVERLKAQVNQSDLEAGNISEARKDALRQSLSNIAEAGVIAKIMRVYQDNFDPIKRAGSTDIPYYGYVEKTHPDGSVDITMNIETLPLQLILILEVFLKN